MPNPLDDMMAATITKMVQPDGRNLQRRVNVCPIPTDITVNASYALTYTNGQVTQIDKTVDDGAGGSNVYRITLSWTGTQLDSISTWSDVTP